MFRHFSMANRVIIGTQHTVKTPVAIASVRVTRTSKRVTNFAETVRAVKLAALFSSCGGAELPQSKSEARKYLNH